MGVPLRSDFLAKKKWKSVMKLTKIVTSFFALTEGARDKPDDSIGGS